MTADVARAGAGGALADAYSAAAASWALGPSRIYDRLAREQLAIARLALRGRRVLDLGAGTGAATRAAQRAGARAVVAVDVAAGMLRVGQRERPPAVVGDWLALPFADRSFDAVVAAFSLNHVDDPVTALREAVRVTGDGGWVLASTYAAEDDHPAKHVVDRVLRAWGWEQESWDRWMRTEASTRTATMGDAAAAAERAGLVDVQVVAREVGFAALGPRQLVEWRLGTAPYAAFLSTLDDVGRMLVANEAVGVLTDAVLADTAGPLVRSVLFLQGRVSRGAGRPPR